MKNVLFIAASLVIVMSSCNSASDGSKEGTKTDTTATVSVEKFGKAIDETGAISMADLSSKMKETASIEMIKVSAPIAECCQQKGCWMTLDAGNGETMRVTFKDYGFFVPKNSAGKTAIIEGKAYHDTTTVEMLREYAKDGGKSDEEIAKIKEPIVELTFEAEGVIIK